LLYPYQNQLNRSIPAQGAFTILIALAVFGLKATAQNAVGEMNEQILAFFHIGLEAYSHGAKPTKIAFMQFPKVSLYSFETPGLLAVGS
jgi:hypothetical protein